MKTFITVLILLFSSAGYSQSIDAMNPCPCDIAAGSGTESSNAVTINTYRGVIIVNSPSIGTLATKSITLTNNKIKSTSTVLVTAFSDGVNLTLGLLCYVKTISDGSCVINLMNLSLLSSFTTNIKINFYVVN